MKKTMTDGSPLYVIISFAIPLLIGNIFQQIYSFADAIIVGNFIGPDALAEVGASGSVVALLIFLLMGFTNGVSILIAQYYGRESEKDICSTVSGLFNIIIMVSVILGVSGYMFSGWILKLMNTPDELLCDATTYLKIMFIGVPALSIYNAESAIVRSMGKNIMPLVVLICSSLLNVGLDIIFILVFNMGVEGAAYATILSQFISAIICTIYMIIKRKELMLSGVTFNLSRKKDYKNILKMGIPTAFQSSVITLGAMCIQGLVNSFGKTTMSAYTAANKIDTIAIQVVVSLGISVSVFTGQNIGAGNIERIRAMVKKVVILQIAVCSLVAIIIVINRESLLRLFLTTKSDEAVSIGSLYISIIGIAYISAGIMQTYLNALKGAGDINFSMKVGMIEVGLRIVIAIILSKILCSATGIWIATPVAWIIACVCTIFRYKSNKWTNLSL